MAKIVVIDDDPEITDLVEYALVSEGYEVFVCSNGREAMDTIKQHRPDVIVLDVMLPGIDGYAVANKLSQDEQTKNIPIVVITALEQSQGMFEKFYQVKAFLPKPFSTERVLETVKSALK